MPTDSVENSNRPGQKPKILSRYILIAGLLVPLVIGAVAIFYLRQNLLTNKNERMGQIAPQQGTEQELKVDKISGKVESVNEENNSFVVSEGVASSRKRLFTVTAGERTEFVKLLYFNGYDPQKPPAFGVKSEPASLLDLRAGDVVYIHIGDFFSGSQINNPTLIEIQKQVQ